MTELSAEDSGLLELLLAEEGIELSRGIPRRRDGADAALSFAQQRLWFLHQLDPSSPAYNLPRAFALRGPLDVGVLERSLGEVVRRHEVLRTTFRTAEPEPVQVVNEARPVKIPAEDLRGLAAGERERRVRQAAEEEARRPFDLEAGPLLRCALLRVADDEHILLFTMHHIVSDEWSAAILINEVSVLYDAFTRGRPSPLPALPVQYADFAVWQREWLRGEELERQLAYWRQQLAGELPPLDLPTDRPRPPVQTFNGASTSLALGERLSEAVRRFSRQEDATLFITLYAAFAALLHRYTGQRDVVVGAPIAGRGRAETEGLIGFFVNALVLRTDLSGDPDFRTLVRRAREVALGAYAHQDLPFELLVKELQPERSLSHTPLFQVIFALRAARGERVELPDLGLELRPLSFGGENAKFDLYLTVEDGGRDLRATFIYNVDLFDDATVERMLRHYRRLLEAAVGEPSRPVSALPLLTDGERRQVLVEWNDTKSPYERDACVHQLFERRAAETPDAVALVFCEESVTYAELNARANRLARRLRGLGVGSDTLVGLCAERSVEMVVGLVAILKAGGAYVPLDASYPAERLSFMLADTRAGVLLTQTRLASRLPAHGARIVLLDGEGQSLALEPEADLPNAATPDGLAYVIYTSGSTGRPKGVAVPHRAVARLVRNTNFASFAPGEVFLQFAPVSFDASTLELWGALLNGARLAIMPPGVPSLEELGRALRRHNVTTLWLTAGLFHLMVDERAEDLRGLRQLIAGGDVLSPEHVARFLRAAPDSVLVNGYGPTENTTFTCCHRLRGDFDAARSVPLGSPVANTTVYVLDRGMRPVVLGAAGELYTGGDGLARGYLNRPGLTAERFVPDPFSAEPGARLYRTGDLVRWLPDGTLEFLGRTDHQVKIRGFRIELGEIEAALGQHPRVREAVVLAREDAPGERRLVAYVVGGPEGAPTLDGLRDHLRDRLPEHMVPSAFVVLDALPLTPHGKIDRGALPAPGESRPELEGGFAAPRTPVEEVIAAVWCDVLGLDSVGTADDFFALGGHSLLAARVVARLRESFGVDLPLRAIFESPTVAHLAGVVEAARADGEALSAPPLVRVPRERPAPLSFAQQSLWFDDQLVPGGNPAYNVQTVVRLDGRLDPDALERALNELVRRHETLRTTFGRVGWQPAQLVAPALAVPLPIKDLTTLPHGEREAEALRLAAEATREPFDLSRGPLLRVTLFRLDAERHVLAIVIHHIVFDAWSMGVFTRELAALYEACRQNLPSPLAELPVQYADYAHWQREWLQGEVLERQLAYWTRQLGGLTELRLPTDRPRPPEQSFRGAHLYFRLPESLSDSLRKLSRRAGVTLYMLTLAAFKTLLHYLSGQEEIAVGTNVANRARVETEGLIGYFANVLVLRTGLADDPTFPELLARVRGVTLGAFTHQEVPFDKVVEALRPERDMSRNPLFQVLFGLNNSAAPVLDLPGLTLTGVEVEKGTNLFDLTLFLTDAGPSLGGLLRYSTDLFDAATVERMRALYETLLARVAADPEARLSSLCDVLSEADRERRQAAVEDLKKSRRQIFKNVRRRAVAEEG